MFTGRKIAKPALMDIKDTDDVNVILKKSDLNNLSRDFSFIWFTKIYFFDP